MTSSLLCNPAADDPRIQRLLDRLGDFYRRGADYPAFQGVVEHQREWATMMPIIDELLRHKERIAVLELGAGRSGFGEALGARRPRVEYHVQDVTAVNADHLQSLADRVYLDPVDSISGEYDLIWSSYVFEHVATPIPFLENVRRLLVPGGWHLMFCPRYDNPAYVCPSLRRQRLLSRCAAVMQVCSGQALSLLDGKARFYVNTDPALFHGAWYRDADAVHVVTRRAVELWHARNAFRCRRLEPRATTFKEWLLVKGMLLANAFQKV
jgi:SAM-dependent methyltransferase